MKIKHYISIIILIALGVGAVYVYPIANLYLMGLKKINVSKKLDFFVPSNSDMNSLSDSLFNKNIIDNKAHFIEWAEKRNLKNSTLEPGKYELKPSMTINDLIINFRKGYGEKEINITFNNARTSQDLAEKITANIEIDEISFLNALKDPMVFQKYGFNETTFPTMFIPNTYRAYWDITLDELLSRMAEEYKKFWTEERKQKAKNLNMTQSQISTLASIVKCETNKKDEAPKIAGVYINRLKQGMPLQADPTLVFAIGDFTIKRILNKDKEIESPYNTYKYSGLPPGPIYIPSSDYIDAVLNYNKHDYLYFCAKEDFSGYSNFAKTYSGHLLNAKKYQSALNKNKVYR